MKAFGKNILLKPLRGKDTTETGLYLPESMKTQKNICKIVSIGDEVSDRLNVGDTVAFSTGHSFEYDNEDYIIAEEKNILVVLS